MTGSSPTGEMDEEPWTGSDGIPSPNPDKIWHPEKWTKSLDNKGFTMNTGMMELDLNPQQAEALKAHVTHVLSQPPYLNGGWPKGTESGSGSHQKKKSAFKNSFQPLMKAWATAFNIPFDNARYQDVIYEIAKQKINASMKGTKKKRDSDRNPDSATTARTVNPIAPQSLSQIVSSPGASPRLQDIPQQVYDTQLSPVMANRITLAGPPNYNASSEADIVFNFHDQANTKVLLRDLSAVCHTDAHGISAIPALRYLDVATIYQDVKACFDLPEFTLVLDSPCEMDGAEVSDHMPLSSLTRIAWQMRKDYRSSVVSYLVQPTRGLKRPLLDEEDVSNESTEAKRLHLTATNTEDDINMLEMPAHDNEYPISQVNDDAGSVTLAPGSPELTYNPDNNQLDDGKDDIEKTDQDEEHNGETLIGTNATDFLMPEQENADKDEENSSGTQADVWDMMDQFCACEHMSKQNWEDVCFLFGRTDTTDLTQPFSFPHLKRSILPHQAYGVYWLLLTRSKIHGAIIGDEQGLGKTTEALFLASLQALLVWLHADFKKNPDKHLKQDTAMQPNAKCPRTEEYHIGIVCVCQLKSSHWLRIALEQNRIQWGPQLFVVPANTLTYDGWMGEFFRTFNSAWQGPFRFTLYVAHGTADVPAHNNIIRLTKQNSRSLLTVSKNDKPFVSQTAAFIITTSQSYKAQCVTNLVDHNVPTYTAVDEKGIEQTCQRAFFRISAIYIDECHQFRGDEGIFARLLKDSNTSSPLIQAALFPMSGTSWENGPIDLRIYIEAFTARWNHWSKRNGGTEELQEAKSKVSQERATQLQSRINTIFQTRGKTTRNNYNTEIKGIAGESAEFFTTIMLRRLQESKWFNQEPILDLPELHQEEIFLEPDDTTAETLNKLADTVREAMRVKYQRSLTAWKNMKKRGPKPTCDPNRLKNMMGSIRAAVTFPFLIELQEQGVIEAFTVNGTASTKLFTCVNEHNLVQYVPKLVASSKRFQYVYSKVKELLNEVETETKPLNPARKQSRIKKIVILSASPVTAALMYTCFFEQLKKDGFTLPDGRAPVVGCYYSGFTPRKKDKILQGFQEAEKLDQHANQKSTAGSTTSSKRQSDRADILIGSIMTLGTGVNLHRASQIFIMEPQYSSSQKNQAVKRIHRVNQRYKCTSVILNSKKVRSEQIAAQKEAFASYFSQLVNEFDEKSLKSKGASLALAERSKSQEPIKTATRKDPENGSSTKPKELSDVSRLISDNIIIYSGSNEE